MATNEPNKADNVINIDPGKRATEEKAAPDQPLQAGGEAPAPEVTGAETVKPAEPDKTAPAPEEKAPAKKAVRRGRPPKAEKASEQEAKKPRKPRAPKEKAAGNGGAGGSAKEAPPAPEPEQPPVYNMIDGIPNNAPLAQIKKRNTFIFALFIRYDNLFINNSGGLNKHPPFLY